MSKAFSIVVVSGKPVRVDNIISMAYSHDKLTMVIKDDSRILGGIPMTHSITYMGPDAKTRYKKISDAYATYKRSTRKKVSDK